MLMTFALTCVAWIFFRSETIQDAYRYIVRMFTEGTFAEQYFPIERYSHNIIALILVFVLAEWYGRQKIEPISGR